MNHCQEIRGEGGGQRLPSFPPSFSRPANPDSEISLAKLCAARARSNPSSPPSSLSLFVLFLVGSRVPSLRELYIIWGSVPHRLSSEKFSVVHFPRHLSGLASKLSQRPHGEHGRKSKTCPNFLPA